MQNQQHHILTKFRIVVSMNRQDICSGSYTLLLLMSNKQVLQHGCNFSPSAQSLTASEETKYIKMTVFHSYWRDLFAPIACNKTWRNC